MIVYLNGSYLPKEEANLSPDDRGFLFADGVYEVLYSYDGMLFREDSHWRRLKRSLHEIRIKGLGATDFGAICRELIERNHLDNRHATIYLQITRGIAPRAHAFPQGVEPTVYAFARPHDPPTELQSSGCRTVTVPDERWLRCDIKSVSLLPNILAKEAAMDARAFESVLVRDGNITECSSAAFGAVYNNEFVTAPLSNLILPSVTRELTLELCENLDIKVSQHAVPAEIVDSLQEAVLMSTTAEIMPITQIDGHIIGDGQPGPVTRRLQEAYRQMIKQDQAIQAATV